MILFLAIEHEIDFLHFNFFAINIKTNSAT